MQHTAEFITCNGYNLICFRLAATWLCCPDSAIVICICIIRMGFVSKKSRSFFTLSFHFICLFVFSCFVIRLSLWNLLYYVRDLFEYRASKPVDFQHVILFVVIYFHKLQITIGKRFLFCILFCSNGCGLSTHLRRFLSKVLGCYRCGCGQNLNSCKMS